MFQKKIEGRKTVFTDIMAINFLGLKKDEFWNWKCILGAVQCK